MNQTKILDHLRGKLAAAEERPADSIWELKFRLKELNTLREKVKDQEALTAKVTQELELQQRWQEFCEHGGPAIENMEDDVLIKQLKERAPDEFDFLLQR